MKKIIIAITAASGSIYAEKLLKRLETIAKKGDLEISIILSDTAKQVWEYELDNTSYKDFNAKYFDFNNYFSAPASGSAKYDSMIICPCTMGTLGRIANATSDNLIIRAADVMLKEQKKLILVLRETPYNLLHINNMQKVAQAGAMILSASPSFYSKPKNIDELIDNFVEKMVSVLGLENEMFEWK